MTSDYLRKIICKLKSNCGNNSGFKILIHDEKKQKVGTLRLIDKGLANNAELIVALTKWRNNAMQFFLSQFVATKERTEQWLSNVAISSHDRLLFVVEDNSGNYVGNVGISNFSSSEAELDNFIRGESGGDPKLILYAELSMLRWIYCNFDVVKVKLQVFSNNWIPISIHLSIGFEITEKCMLSKTSNGSDVQYHINSTEGEPVNFSYLQMVLTRNNFFEVNSNYKC